MSRLNYWPQNLKNGYRKGINRDGKITKNRKERGMKAKACHCLRFLTVNGNLHVSIWSRHWSVVHLWIIGLLDQQRHNRASAGHRPGERLGAGETIEFSLASYLVPISSSYTGSCA